MHFLVPLQVLREFRSRAARAGAALTTVEKDNWATQSYNFMTKKRKASETSASSSTRALKTSQKRPRLASYTWLTALHNALEAGGKGLLHFMPSDPARPFDSELREGEQLEPMAVGFVDEHQLQWCGAQFLQKGTHRMSLLLFADPFHRRHNDAWNAVIAAGLGVWAMLLISIVNISYGPWSKGKQISSCLNQCMNCPPLVAQTTQCY